MQRRAPSKDRAQQGQGSSPKHTSALNTDVSGALQQSAAGNCDLQQPCWQRQLCVLGSPAQRGDERTMVQSSPSSQLLGEPLHSPETLQSVRQVSPEFCTPNCGVCVPFVKRPGWVDTGRRRSGRQLSLERSKRSKTFCEYRDQERQSAPWACSGGVSLSPNHSRLQRRHSRGVTWIH